MSTNQDPIESAIETAIDLAIETCTVEREDVIGGIMHAIRVAAPILIAAGREREEKYRADLQKLHEAGLAITGQCNALRDENKQLREQINALISRPYVPEVGTL